MAKGAGKGGKVVTVTEYGKIGTPGACGVDAFVDESAFADLKGFLLQAADPPKTREPSQILALRGGRGGEVIQALNHVGVITTANGTAVEILPKIAKTSFDESRELLIRMLLSLRTVSHKNLGRSMLASCHTPLFETFILMFVSEVEAIARAGFRSGYSTVSSNSRAFKGKLLVARDVRENPVNRARSFTQHQSFGLDRPENRILKAALEMLAKQTGDHSTRRRIRRLLSSLEGAGNVDDIAAELSRCTGERGTEMYRAPLAWAEVFLKGLSFSSFAGDSRVEALLFPMDRLFEDYIGAKLRHALASDEAVRGLWRLSLQDTGTTLFDGSHGGVSLRPDMVLSSAGRTVIVDTKWKLLGCADPRPDRGDLYQMYAYGKRYHADKVVLVYPLSSAGGEGASPKSWHERSGDAPFDVHAYFVNLAKAHGEGLGRLLEFATQT